MEDLKRSFILFWQNIFNFTGVTPRKDYWFAYLANILLILIIGIFTSLIAPAIGNSYISSVLEMAFAIVFSVYLLGYIVGSVSIYIRRMRDIGKTVTFAVILMICGIIPYLGIIPGIYSIYLTCQPSFRKEINLNRA